MAIRVLPFYEAGVTFASDRALTPDEAVRQAGLDFPVALTTAYDNYESDFRASSEWQFTRREDTGGLLGVVKSTYKPIQNLDAFSFLNVVTDTGEAIIRSGGQARGGAIAWLYAQVPEDVTLEAESGEQITVGFMVSNGHDGKRALRATPILLRVATGTVLSGRALGVSFGLRHAGSMEGKVAEARQALGITFGSLNRLNAVAGRMFGVTFTRSQVDDMIAVLAPAADESAVHPKVQERRDGIRAVLYGSPSLTGYRNDRGDVNGWGFWMAVCEFADYFAPYRDSFRASAAENRLLSVTAGDAWKLKDKALALVLASAR